MLPLNLMFFPGHQAMLNRGVLRLARLVAEVLDARRISSHSGFGSQVQLDERSCDNCRLGNFQSGSFLLNCSLTLCQVGHIFAFRGLLGNRIVCFMLHGKCRTGRVRRPKTSKLSAVDATSKQQSLSKSL